MAVPTDITQPCDSSYLMFLHCNAQSARNKCDALTPLFSEIRSPIQVIMITETWYTCEEEVLRLPGYQTFFLNRLNRRGGGVLQLVSDEITCSLVPEFSAVTPDVEVLTLSHKNYLFVTIYRPPDGNVDKFIEFLETILSHVTSETLDVIIGGDFNINLLKNTANTREFELCLKSFCCENLITEPTRISGDSESLLDLFVVNNPSKCVKSGTIITDVSDHLPIYMFYKHSAKYGSCTRPPQSHCVQDITSETLTAFRNQIQIADWRPVLNCTSSDSSYDTFIDTLKKTYHNCFKWKTINR